MAKDVKFSIIALNKTEKAFSQVRKGLGGLNKSVLKMGVSIAGLAGVAGFGAMAKNAMDVGDKIHKLNIRLGASTEALSQYRHIATMSGVSFETLTMGWQRMTRRVAEAANGTGEARNALKELGISAVELNKLAPEKQFEVLADAIAKVENPADRVRLAMKLFDSEGVSLIQMMEGGAEGLRTMRDEADSLGMTLSKDMVSDMAAANDSMAKVGSQINSMVMSIMADLAPSITEIAGRLQSWFTANREIISQKMDTVVNSLTITFEYLKPAALAVAKTFEVVGKSIGWVAFQIWRAIDAVNSFFSAGGASIGTGPAVAATTGGTQLTGAAAIAAAGGGSGFTGKAAELDSWSGSGGSGASVVNNFNTQITRSDAVAIASESARMGARQ